jgi:CRP-like cAMP-binding protein
MDPRELLGMIAFFSEALNGDEIFALASGAERRTFDVGQALVREGEPGESMFVIESGQVTVKVGDDPVAELFAGDFLGEMSLLTGAPRNATVTALEPVAAYEIRKEVLAPVLAESPTLVDRLAETMEKRQIELDRAYGSGAWGMVRPGDAEVHGLIRKFYEGTTSKA